MSISYPDFVRMEEEDAKVVIGTMLYETFGGSREDHPIDAAGILEWFTVIESTLTLTEAANTRFMNDLLNTIDPIVAHIIRRFSLGGIEWFIEGLRVLRGLYDIQNEKMVLPYYDRHCRFVHEKLVARITFHIKRILGCPLFLCDYLLPIIHAQDEFTGNHGLLPINNLRDNIRFGLKITRYDWAIIEYNPANPYKVITTIVRATELIRKVRRHAKRLGRLTAEISELNTRIKRNNKRQFNDRNEIKSLQDYLAKATQLNFP